MSPSDSAGDILYHGPVAGALPHFAALGFDCPPRKDMASFLQEVSTPAGQAAYATAALRASKGALSANGLVRGSMPQSLLVPVAELAELFRTQNEHGEGLKGGYVGLS